jgi:hypothetical protein
MLISIQKKCDDALRSLPRFIPPDCGKALEEYTAMHMLAHLQNGKLHFTCL